MSPHLMVLALLMACASVWTGCARSEGIAHDAHDYILDAGGGRDATKMTTTPDDFSGEPFRLVAIAEDGMTTIETAATGERFSARPGEFFSRADGTGGPWGRSGLQLLAAARQTGVACFRRRTARNVAVWR